VQALSPVQALRPDAAFVQALHPDAEFDLSLCSVVLCSVPTQVARSSPLIKMPSPPHHRPYARQHITPAANFNHGHLNNNMHCELALAYMHYIHYSI